MDLTLREKLKRLGVHRGTSALITPAQPGPREVDVAAPVAGEAERLWDFEARTPFGLARIRRRSFPLAHVHGDRPLQRAAADSMLGLRPANAVFLDTETTGLAGGAGTLAFLVGVGYFVDDGLPEQSGAAFVIDQYFLRDPGEEAAMLAHLDGLLGRREGLVTFNGRAFDVPLLETRFTLARIAPAFSGMRHLDLLMPARRVWRGSLASCSLGSLEYHLLHVRRDQQDIAGFLIPQLYREYLQHGAPHAHAEMARVQYHNLHDVLSMVTLVSRLHDAFERPDAPEEHRAVAVQHESAGEHARAAEAWARSLAKAEQREGPGAQATLHARRHLAAAYKRLGRRSDAVEQWQMLAASSDASALLELAMHYEWTEKDPRKALTCARHALRVAADPVSRRALEHRILRLERKSTPADAARR